MKAVQQARLSSFGYNSSFLGSYQFSRLESRFNSITPKINDQSDYKKEESIFKLIEEDSDYQSEKPSQPSQQKCNTTLNVPEFSPVPPMIPQVQETNSIRRETPI